LANHASAVPRAVLAFCPSRRTRLSRHKDRTSSLPAGYPTLQADSKAFLSRSRTIANRPGRLAVAGCLLTAFPLSAFPLSALSPGPTMMSPPADEGRCAYGHRSLAIERGDRRKGCVSGKTEFETGRARRAAPGSGQPRRSREDLKRGQPRRKQNQQVCCIDQPTEGDAAEAPTCTDI